MHVLAFMTIMSPRTSCVYNKNHCICTLWGSEAQSN